MARRCMPAAEKGLRPVNKTITSADLDESGKLYPAKMPKGSGLLDEKKKPKVVKATDDEVVEKRIYVPLLKANAEQRTVTGIVLQPEVVDGQGDIIGAEVIMKAAHNFLAAFNKATKLGLMHKDFAKRFELLESYIAPQDLVINDKLVTAGSWVMKVRVKDDKVWKAVKEGKITGFSIGGKAKVVKVAA